MDAAAPSPLRWLWRVLLGAAGLVLVCFLALLFFPWNSLREPLANHLSTQFGHKVVIDGDVEVKLAWHPWVDIHGLSIANAPWSDQPLMAVVDRIGLRVIPLSYFTRLRIPEIELEAPRAILERNKIGEKNWEIGESASELPLIGRVRVTDGDLRFRDADPNVRLDVKVHALTAADRQGQESLVFSGDGTLRGGRFRIAGQGEGLGALREVDEPFSLVFNAKAADAEVWFDGTVVPNEPDNVRGFIKIVGNDMSQLYPLLPAPIPWTPPYALKGDVAHLADRWKVTNLAGKVGQSDLAGTMEILTLTPRRKVVADLTSTRLDYRDLGGFVGLPPGRNATVRSATQKAAAQRLARAERVFEDKRFELERLRDYDVEFRFRGKNVHVDRVPMDSVDATIVLDNGVLRYAPVKFGIADGQIVVVGTLDANAVPPRFDARIEGRNLDLARIYPELASPRGKTGRFGGFIKVKTQGASIAKMADAADGDGALIMSGGEASALALLLTNLDLAGAVPLIIGGDQTASLYCAVSAFAVDEGVVTPRLLVIDTSKVRIDGEGTVDLGKERYNLALKSKSKQFSLFALRGPIVIGGSLRNPSVGPAVAPIAARVGVAAGLAAVLPPLAILPFIDLGGTPDVDCRNVLGASDNASVPTKNDAGNAMPSASREETSPKAGRGS